MWEPGLPCLESRGSAGCGGSEALNRWGQEPDVPVDLNDRRLEWAVKAIRELGHGSLSLRGHADNRRTWPRRAEFRKRK